MKYLKPANALLIVCLIGGLLISSARMLMDNDDYVIRGINKSIGIVSKQYFLDNIRKNETSSGIGTEEDILDTEEITERDEATLDTEGDTTEAKNTSEINSTDIASALNNTIDEEIWDKAEIEAKGEIV